MRININGFPDSNERLDSDAPAGGASAARYLHKMKRTI